MLDSKVNINLQDFYQDLIGFRDEQALLYIYDFDKRDFLFQGDPLGDRKEWKEVLKQYKFSRVNCIEWGVAHDGTPWLCININSTRR